ncbi:FecCD family ABC transporter permease [Mammaliicoccus sp. JADD-157]|uniref:FecCD family ABC transporter permease n=1 Tax=Mammaliicoccus sp. JADD-157 TaxID=3404818 RepID=UPI003BB798BC
MTEKINKKDTFHLIIALIFLVAISIVSLMIGSSFISLQRILVYFVNPSESIDQFTLEVLRIPRITLAILAGGALGMSGLMLQNVLKNPIASPDIMGITGGASLSAVFFIAFLSHLTIQLLPLFAVLGGTMAMVILLLFQNKGQIKSTTLIIIGISMQTLFIALVQGLLITTKQLSAAKAYTWLVGSLYGATFTDTVILGSVMIAVIPLILLVIPKMKISILDDPIAIGLGLHVQRMKLIQLVTSTILVSIAISLVGNISFVGLIAPHIAKSIIRGSYAKKLVMSAVIGAISIVIADLIGRTLFLPKEVPAGIFIAAFGAPFFIYLLLTAKKL